MSEITVKIEGMSCQHCVMRVKKAIEGLQGILSLDVQIGSARVGFDDSKLSKADIEKAITAAGYKTAA